MMIRTRMMRKKMMTERSKTLSVLFCRHFSQEKFPSKRSMYGNMLP